jgi:Mrp family chromosome partitioning ATPase
MTADTTKASQEPAGESLGAPYGRLVGSAAARRFFQALDNNLFMTIGNEPRSIVLGSPSPGEGKTLFSLLLAYYSSQLHENGFTLLVDATRTCDAIRALGMADGQSRSLVHTQVGEPAKAIQPSPFPRLHACQVFEYDDRRSLLPKEKLDVIAGMARKKYSTIVVDCASAQESNDYVALAHFFANILIVTRQRHTRKEQLLAQLRALEDAGCRALGYVINDRKFAIPNWVYGR